MVNLVKTLAELKPGQRGRVTGLKQAGILQRRLRDIGLIEGTLVTCELQRQSGGISAFKIRGALIALRQADSKNITVCAPLETAGDEHGLNG